MSPVLFYTPGTCALACMVALEWRGEPYDACHVSREARGSAEYERINPKRQVPALRVDGRILVEVNAILAHVADRAPSAGILPPNGTPERDLANQWLSYLGSGFHAAFWPFYNPQRYTRDPAGHDAVKGAAVDAIRRELAFVDAHLAKNERILGDVPSVLDGYLYAMARWGVDALDLKEFPEVSRHMKLLAADPKIRVGLAIERGRPLPAGATAAVSQRIDLSELPG